MPTPRFSGGMKTFPPETSSPSMYSSPPVGFSKPAIMRSMVVLPQPEGPSRVMNSPSANSASKSRRTTLSPNALVMFLIRTVAIALPPQMENSPLVRRLRMKFRSMTISRMPKAMAQLMGWLVKVQYS